MIDEINGNCPICFASIDPWKFDWDCPVCSEKNKNIPIYAVCKRCKFGPRLIKCPACNKEFEGMLLIGSFTGKKMKILSPENFSQLKQYSYKLGELDFKISGHVIEQDLVNLGKETLQSILNTVFKSPVSLSRFLLQTYFKDDKEFNWFHGWAFQNKGRQSKSEEATAQISFYFQASLSKPRIKIKVTDVLVDTDLLEKESQNMIIGLKELEPINIPTIDNQEASMFTNHLTGNEIFKFDGNVKPQLLLIHSLKYNYPSHSFATGWLLSIDYDTLMTLSNQYQNDDDYNSSLKKYMVGSIHIEYGGTLQETRITSNTGEIK